MKKLAGILGSALLLGASSAAIVPAEAATVTYELQRVSPLTNVDDAEGRWQFDGGRVYLNNYEVGRYVRKKRVSFGASPLNRAATDITIIWKWGDHNFTLQGTHYFHDGREVGGVSAASSGFSAFEDATFSGNHNAITITY